MNADEQTTAGHGPAPHDAPAHVESGLRQVDDAVATLALGHVEGVVGAADQGFGRGAHAWTPTGGAEAAGDHVRAVVDRHGLTGEGGAHALGLAGGAGLIAAGKDDQKLLAAVTADGVVRTGDGLHAAGEFAQDGIAGEVAVGVVDGFEVIEVGQDEADGTVFAGAAGELALEDIEDRGAVPDAGEKILGGLLAQLLAGGNQFALQIDDAGAGAEADLEFMLVEGLGEIVVGTGFHAFNQVLTEAFRSQEQDVRIGVFILGAFVVVSVFAHAAADFGTSEAGHDPVENGELGRVLGLQVIPGFDAVAGDNDFIAPFAESGVEEVPRDNTVIGN